MKFEYLIALRHLTHRRKKGFISLISFISIAGIAVGVMALIVVLSVMSGFDRELKTKIIGANPHIIVMKSGGLEEADKVVETIKNMQLEQIVSVAPYIEGQVIIRSETNATGTIIKGITANDNNVQSIHEYVSAGSIEALFDLDKNLADDEPQGGIVIGSILAQLLRVSVGDTVHVISPYLEKRGLLPPRAKTIRFEVTGIFEFGMNNLDTSLAIVSLPFAQELFNLENKTSGVAIRLKNVFTAQKMKVLIQDRLGYPYWAQSWIDMNRTFFSALQVEKNVMSVLLFLIILVAGFNIVSTLIMVVMEKTKDIGILKSLGATNFNIMKIFVWEGFVVGFFGVVVGLVSGLLITFNLNAIADFLEQTFGFEVFPSDIYYFNKIPIEINPDDIIMITMFALIIAIIAGIYPARKAVALNPVEALRYE